MKTIQGINWDMHRTLSDGERRISYACALYCRLVSIGASKSGADAALGRYYMTDLASSRAWFRTHTLEQNGVHYHLQYSGTGPPVDAAAGTLRCANPLVISCRTGLPRTKYVRRGTYCSIVCWLLTRTPGIPLQDISNSNLKRKIFSTLVSSVS